MDKIKRLLIITYVFPPFAAVGVYRILKFCKYLPAFGVQPIILTPRDPNTMAKDEGLMAQVSPDLHVYHTPNFEPFRWKNPDTTIKTSPNKSTQNQQKTNQLIQEKPSALTSFKREIKSNLSIPDTSVFWSWTGLLSGIRTVRQEKIDMILSSSPPHSVHLLGSRIAKFTNKPHIVDFRDLWTQNTSYMEKNLPDYLARRDRKYEENVLKRSTFITVNTETFKKQLLEKNPFLLDDRIEVVSNGVDPDDFKDFITSGTGSDRFTVLYTGSLYGGHRNPEFFFSAVKQWLTLRPEIASQLRLLFVGNWAPELSNLVTANNLGEVVEKKEWLPQREVLKITFSADLLLLIQGFDPALSAAIPRKLFEYMITNKPILAFAPPGEIPNMIDQYQCGISLHSPEPEPIISYLETSFTEWKQKKQTGQITHSLRSIPDLETRTHVQKLAELCHRI